MCSSSSLPGNPASQVGNIHICQRDLSRDICQRWSQFAEGIANILHFDFHGCGRGVGVPDLNPNPRRSRFFWDSLSNWNFTRMNLDCSQDSCMEYIQQLHMTNQTSGALTKSQLMTKLHLIRDKRILSSRSSQLGGIEVLKASISVPHALTLQGLAQLILQLLQLHRETDCIWLLPLHVLPHCTHLQ